MLVDCQSLHASLNDLVVSLSYLLKTSEQAAPLYAFCPRHERGNVKEEGRSDKLVQGRRDAA